MKNIIQISTNNSIYFLEPNEVLYGKGVSKRSTLHLVNGDSLGVPLTIEEIEVLLKGKGFIRTHEHFLVNRNHIKLIDIEHQFSLILINNEKIPLSADRRTNVMKSIESDNLKTQ
jgi:two-component system, LytTR family, response regulator